MPLTLPNEPSDNPQEKNRLERPRKNPNLRRKGVAISDKDMDKLLDLIRLKGIAIPGELAKELGCARSSLAYNLNLLVKKNYIERIGGGRSTRYRALTHHKWYRRFIGFPKEEPVQPLNNTPATMVESAAKSTPIPEPVTEHTPKKGWSFSLKSLFKL